MGMDGEFSTNWTSWLEDAYLLYTPEDPECLKYHYLTRTEEDEPRYTVDEEIRYTVDEEIAMINQQIEESEGFDIDFSLFRCLFNYHLVDPDYPDFVDDVKNEVLMEKLSRESLELHNLEENTNFEFLKVVKANFHFCNGYIFLITFEALDPSDNLEKIMQARVFYSSHAPPKYIFCRLKPDSTVNSDETSEDDDSSDDETPKEDVEGSQDDV